MPLKFLGRSGSGSTKDAIEAINYAIDRKQNGVNVRIISASWGSTAYSRALEDAIRAAGEAGILFVAAAGNNGTSNDKRAHYPSNYDLPNVISVAATDKTDVLESSFEIREVLPQIGRAVTQGESVRVEAKVGNITVPLSYADELYSLRSHINLVRRRLEGTHWKRRLPAVAMLSPNAIGEAYLRPVDY